MSLPTINAPIYELTLPIKNEKIKYRPFNIKEQKILMIALESNDGIFINENVKEVMKACTKSEIDIDFLSTTDVEYFFLHLRARSIGEIIKPRYRCKNVVDGKICETNMEKPINVLDVSIDLNDYNDVIELDTNLGFKMKHPNFDIVKNFNSNLDINNITSEIIAGCVEYVFDSEKLYYKDEYTKEDLIEWIDNLNNDQFKKIEEHFTHLPKLKKQFNLTCETCGYEHEIVLEGLENFLA